MTGELAQRFLPVIIGARVGDAMGAPTEGLSFEEIESRFGWVGTFEGEGTDDSLMATLLAEALVATGGHAGPDAWAAQMILHHDQVLEMRDSFFVSVIHTAEKLVYDFPPRRVATGNMPSSSSAMCIWPVGLVNAGNPPSAAAQAYSLAALLHTGAVDFCQDAAAAVAAAIAIGLRPDTSMSDATEGALDAIHPVSGAGMRTLIGDSVSMATDSSGYEDFRIRYRNEFSRSIPCDARETVPAAFALAALSGGQLLRGVEYAANFGRDTDTIATITGALCGAVGGPWGIPEKWQADLGDEALAAAVVLADRLEKVAHAKALEWIQLAQSVPGVLGDHS